MNEILNSQVKNSQLKYLIKWTEIEENSWIKFMNVMNVIEIMNIYHAQNSNHSNKDSWISYVQTNNDFKYEFKNWKCHRSFDFKREIYCHDFSKCYSKDVEKRNVKWC